MRCLTVMSRARHEGERVVGTLPGKAVLGKVETLHIDTGIACCSPTRKRSRRSCAKPNKSLKVPHFQQECGNQSNSYEFYAVLHFLQLKDLPDQFQRADHLADRAALLVAVDDPRMFDTLVVQSQKVGIV